MSKIFKNLLLITLICLTCATFFACGGKGQSAEESQSVSIEESVSIKESIKDSEVESVKQSEEESEDETESNFTIELPEVGRN